MAEERLRTANYRLLFGIRRLARYHDRHCRFYGIWNTLTNVITALSTGAAGILLAGGAFPLRASIAVAASVSVLNVLDLAVGTARRANAHADLVRRFMRLEERFAGGDLEKSELAAVRQERLTIEASEPPRLRLLDALCHFELLSEDGRDDGREIQQPAVPWYRAMMMHLLSQPQYASKLRGPDIASRTSQSSAARSGQ